MKTPQVKPDWATGAYIGNGTVVPDKTNFKGLQQLLDDLANTTNHDKQEKLIENEACKHKESIRELCEENAELKRKLWEYENNYRVGKYPTS